MAVSRKPRPVDPEPVPVTEDRTDIDKYVSRMKVWFDDGTDVVLSPNRPRVQAMFEAAHEGRRPSSIEDIMWILWHCLGRPTVDGVAPDAPDTERLDAWIDTVDDTEWVRVERPGKAQ